MQFLGYFVRIIHEYVSGGLQVAPREQADQSSLPLRAKLHLHLQVQPACKLGIAPVDGAIELPSVQGDP